jgi:hypothetical protein
VRMSESCARLALHLALLGALAGAPVCAGQDGRPEAVAALFGEARYDEALVEAARLEDAVLAAEWSSYIHATAGDLPGSLRAARVGLRLQPDHRGLLVNALTAALTLGLSELSLELARRLEAVLAGAPQGTTEAELERARRLLDDARNLAALDAVGTQRAARARWTASIGLCAVIGLLLYCGRDLRRT